MITRKLAFPSGGQRSVVFGRGSRHSHAAIASERASRITQPARQYLANNPEIGARSLRLIQELNSYYTEARPRVRFATLGTNVFTASDDSSIFDLASAQAGSVLTISCSVSGGPATFEVLDGTSSTKGAITNLRTGWTGSQLADQFTVTSGTQAYFAFKREQRYIYLNYISGSGTVFSTVYATARKRLPKGF